MANAPSSIGMVKAEAQEVYSTGFESSDGFTVDTNPNYQGTKTSGKDGYQWTIKGGAFSTNNAITDSQSAQVRRYKGTSGANEIFMNFDVASADTVSFNVKGSISNCKCELLYSTDKGNTWNSAISSPVASKSSNISWTAPSTLENVRFKISITGTNPTSGNKYAVVDDFSIKSSNAKTYTEIHFSEDSTPKKNYFIGDSFDATGIKVLATVSGSGETEDVTGRVAFAATPATFSTAGEISVSVSATLGGETPLTTAEPLVFVVTVTDLPDYKLVESSADLTLGKEYLIASPDFSQTMGEQPENTKYRALVSAEGKYNSETKILKRTDKMHGYRILPMDKAGKIGLYDTTDQNFISAVSSSSNDIGAVSYSASSEAIKASIQIADGGETHIVFGGYARNDLRYNASGKRFSLYDTTNESLAKPYLFEATETSGMPGLVWAGNFNARVELECNADGNGSAIVGDWAEVKSDYEKEATSDLDKLMIQFGTAKDNGNEVEKALAAYDYIINKYLSLDDFLGRRNSASSDAAIVNHGVDSSTAIVVTIAAFGAVAIGSYFFLRKKKQF